MMPEWVVAEPLLPFHRKLRPSLGRRDKSSDAKTCLIALVPTAIEDGRKHAHQALAPFMCRTHDPGQMFDRVIQGAIIKTARGWLPRPVTATVSRLVRAILAIMPRRLS